MAKQREQIVKELESGSFDLLIIGGGATGAGILHDASLRGYKAALVEARDYSSQTSSRSTKLLHGGVRYLENAFRHLDKSQFLLVKEGLEERGLLFKMAPYLTRSLPIYIPIFSWLDAFYYWTGIKVYSYLAGGLSIGKSRWAPYEELITLFPKLKREHLKGGILYCDGQFNDSRMNISLILTAIENGGLSLNYCEVKEIDAKNGTVEVIDGKSLRSFQIRSKVIINATGPFADTIRKMDDPSTESMIRGSAGSHLVTSLSQKAGLLIPKTSDGRVIFILPWEGRTLMGTTDIPRDASFDPSATEGEKEYILDNLSHYLGIKLEKQEILCEWSGIRPLLDKKGKTSALLRDFAIEKSKTGMYSILGGKWTSFRRMAESLLDEIVSAEDLPYLKECQTRNSELVGTGKIQKDKIAWLGNSVADHLIASYGTKSLEIAEIARNENLSTPIEEGFPYIEAELAWAVREEYAITPEDVLNRRLRLGMLDRKAADRVKDKVQQFIPK